jgi:hypothetical protein
MDNSMFRRQKVGSTSSEELAQLALPGKESSFYSTLHARLTPTSPLSIFQKRVSPEVDIPEKAITVPLLPLPPFVGRLYEVTSEEWQIKMEDMGAIPEFEYLFVTMKTGEVRVISITRNPGFKDLAPGIDSSEICYAGRVYFDYPKGKGCTMIAWWPDRSVYEEESSPVQAGLPEELFSPARPQDMSVLVSALDMPPRLTKTG